MGQINVKPGTAYPGARSEHKRAWPRTLRSAVIVLLLTGGLLPSFGPIPVTLIAAIVAVPLVLHELIRALPVVHPMLPFAIGLFVLFGVSVLVTGPTNEYGTDKATTFFTLTMLGVLAAALVRNKQDLRSLATTWVIVSTILAAFALAGFTGTERAAGFAASPIWLGRALATGALCALWLWWQTPRRRALYLAAAAFLLVGILATGSRGPLIGLALGALVLALVYGQFSIRRLLGLTTVAAIGVVALQALPIFADSRLVSSASDASQSSNLRELFWALTGETISAHPLGIGIGNWAAVTVPPAGYLYPHNLFLEIAAESGIIIGSIFALVVVALTVRLGRVARHSPQALLVLALFASELVAVNVSGDLNARTFFFLVGLAFFATTNRFSNEETPRPAMKTERGARSSYAIA